MKNLATIALAAMLMLVLVSNGSAAEPAKILTPEQMQMQQVVVVQPQPGTVVQPTVVQPVVVQPVVVQPVQPVTVVYVTPEPRYINNYYRGCGYYNYRRCWPVAACPPEFRLTPACRLWRPMTTGGYGYRP